ncbi:listerin E3 ubiquitin protein ligase 1 [Clydaea vesicula]|uniref:E3 ubiquitin-protein ligase listerin n=1 Tax=Clydaea vesicula TaxID=447962 RepID=A0AAD5U2N2_9FUNG|nr:listerin E3 ubiquitin protein ligase 1 [Clydaea vesicula]
MGKDKGSNLGRVKGNAEPAGKARAAENLLNTPAKLAFGAAAVNQNSTLEFSKMTDERNFHLTANLRVILKKLQKRDTVTKIKALDELFNFLNSSEIQDILPLLPIWPNIFNKFSIDFEKRIRLKTFECHALILKKIDIKTDFKLILKQVICCWMLATLDPAKEVANVAKASFTSSFPEKTEEVILYCKGELITFVSDNILTQSPDTLSDARFCTLEERDSKYIRVVACCFELLLLVFDSLEYLKLNSFFNSEALSTLLDSGKFWDFSFHKATALRKSYFTFVKIVCQKYPELISSRLPVVQEHFFGNLFSTDLDVVEIEMWESLLLFTKLFPNSWNIITEKPLIEKFFNFVKNGADNSIFLSFPCILPLVSNFPSEIVSQQNTVKNLMESIWKSFKFVDFGNSCIYMNTYFECILWILSNSEKKYQEYFFNEYVFKIIELLYFSNKISNLQLKLNYKEINNIVALFVVKIGVNAHVEEKYFQLLNLKIIATLSDFLKCPNKILAKNQNFKELFLTTAINFGCFLNFLQSESLKYKDFSNFSFLKEQIHLLISKSSMTAVEILNSEDTDLFAAVSKLYDILPSSKFLDSEDFVTSKLLDLYFSSKDDIVVSSLLNSITDYINSVNQELATVAWNAAILKFCSLENTEVAALNSLLLKLANCEKQFSHVKFQHEKIDSLFSAHCNKNVIHEGVEDINSIENIKFCSLCLILNERYRFLTNVIEENAISEFKKKLTEFISLNLHSQKLTATLINFQSYKNFFLFLKIVADYSISSILNKFGNNFMIDLIFLNFFFLNSNFQEVEEFKDFTNILDSICVKFENFFSKIKIKNRDKTFLDSFLSQWKNYIADASFSCSVAVWKKLILKVIGYYPEDYTLIIDTCCKLANIWNSCGNRSDKVLNSTQSIYDNFQIFSPFFMAYNGVNQEDYSTKVADRIFFVIIDLIKEFGIKNFFFDKSLLSADKCLLLKELMKRSLSKINLDIQTPIIEEPYDITEDEEVYGEDERCFLEKSYLLKFLQYSNNDSMSNPNVLEAITSTLNEVNNKKVAANISHSNIRSETFFVNCLFNFYFSDKKNSCYEEGDFKNLNLVLYGLKLVFQHAKNTIKHSDVRKFLLFLNEFNFEEHTLLKVVIVEALCFVEGVINATDSNDVALQSIKYLRELKSLTVENENYISAVEHLYLVNTLLEGSKSKEIVISAKDLIPKIRVLLKDVENFSLTKKRENCFISEVLRFFKNFLILSLGLNLITLGSAKFIVKLFTACLEKANSLNDMEKVTLFRSLGLFIAIKEEYENDSEIWSMPELEPESMHDIYKMIFNFLLKESDSTINNEDHIVKSHTIFQNLLSEICHDLPEKILLEMRPFEKVLTKEFVHIQSLRIEMKTLEEETEYKLPDPIMEAAKYQLNVNLTLINFEDFSHHVDLASPVLGYLISWMTLFDHFDDATFALKAALVSHLSDHDEIFTIFLEFIFSLIGLGTSANAIVFDINKYDFRSIEMKSFDEEVEFAFPLLASHLYWRCLRVVPTLVRTWCSLCKNRQLLIAVESFTEKYYSPLIIQEEFKAVLSADRSLFEGVSVKKINNEILASYAVEEAILEMIIKLPQTYPLRQVEIEGGSGNNAGVAESRWRSWLLSAKTVMVAQNASMVEAIVIFRKNISLHFEGVEDCAICYSIISVLDRTLPTKQCKTCKNLFHGSCLYKV